MKFHYLYERAFELQKNESGRIVYNGRLVHPDTGEWIYQLAVLTVYNAFSKDIGILNRNKPTKQYNQLEILY
jgi:hypothetical protein